MKYPKILLLHMTKVHAKDTMNLLVRNLFGDWPKENLAQVYTGLYSGEGEFCGQYYEIGIHDRRFGHIFNLLKPTAVSVTSGRKFCVKMSLLRTPIWMGMMRRVTSVLIASGVCEVIFRIRLSNTLARFVDRFNPEIIYTQGYSLNFAKLALIIAQEFKIPICYFPMDDWHSSLYYGSPVHREVDSVATAIARSASLRFALGPKMTEILTERYKVPFECFYHADDIRRFMLTKTPNATNNQAIVIGYTGSLYLGRAQSILDLLNSCQLLHRMFKIRVYCTELPADIPSVLLDSEHLEFLPLPNHERLPQVLGDCDILFLPESFDPAKRKAIELSLSTKSHLYMMSRRPILVYGPPWSGTTDYARRFSWGVVVDKRDKQDLLEGLKLAVSESVVNEIVVRAYNVAKQNHEVEALRKRVLQKMLSVVRDCSVKPVI